MRKLKALGCWVSLIAAGGGASAVSALAPVEAYRADAGLEEASMIEMSAGELAQGYDASGEDSSDGPLAQVMQRGLMRSADLNELTPYIGANTLVVFDIDDTLISDEETTDITAVTDRTKKILYLTSRRAKYEESTRDKLRERGVLVSRRWLPRDLRPFNIIFTSKGRRLAHKGPYLLASVNELIEAGVQVSNVIFVDDRPSQVRSVVEHFSEAPVPCLGVIFDRYIRRDEEDHRPERLRSSSPTAERKELEAESGIIEEVPEEEALAAP